MVAAQIAMMSRLRSLYVAYEGDSILLEKFEKSSAIVRASGDIWDHQPEGWTAKYDTLLISRLVHFGLTDKFTEGEDAMFSLSKGSVQQRANQLARELHSAEECISVSSRVLEERRNASLPPPAVCVASKLQQQTDEKPLVVTGGRGGSHQIRQSHVPINVSSVIDLVYSSDDDVGEILGKAPTTEKRKSNDTNDSSSDKKARKC